jgi:membrane-associated phospholipid phosphatase
MTSDPVFAKLLRGSLLALLVCAMLVTVCYFFVDRQVAYFVRDHEVNQHVVLKWLTYPPPYLQGFAPVVLVVLMLRRAWGPFRRWEQTVFAVCVSLLISIQFKDSLKYAFGRTWPDTWIKTVTHAGIEENPSLLRDGEAGYGFHPFHSDYQTADWYASFPSGHTTRTVAIVAVVWIAYPRWRWLCILATLAVAIGLIGMNYHFVGDVIGGCFVGGIVGAYTTFLCGLGKEAPPSSAAQSLRSDSFTEAPRASERIREA